MNVSSDCRWCNHPIDDHSQDGPCNRGRCGCFYWEGSDAYNGKIHWETLVGFWRQALTESDCGNLWMSLALAGYCSSSCEDRHGIEKKDPDTREGSLQE